MMTNSNFVDRHRKHHLKHIAGHLAARENVVNRRKRYTCEYVSEKAAQTSFDKSIFFHKTNQPRIWTE